MTANESKVGRTSLTPFIKSQIQKDVNLLNNNDNIKGIVWHFYTSPVTGLGGPTAPLMKALQKANISIVIH